MSEFDITNYVVAAYRAHFDLDESAIQVMHEEDVEPVWTCFTDALTFTYRLRAYTVIQTVKLFLKPGQSLRGSFSSTITERLDLKSRFILGRYCPKVTNPLISCVFLAQIPRRMAPAELTWSRFGPCDEPLNL